MINQHQEIIIMVYLFYIFQYGLKTSIKTIIIKSIILKNANELQIGKLIEVGCKLIYSLAEKDKKNISYINK